MLILRCAILFHKRKFAKAFLVTNPPQQPPSEGFHLAATLKKSLRRRLLRSPEVKKPQNNVVRMLGNEFSPQREVLQREDIFCGVVATAEYNI